MLRDGGVSRDPNRLRKVLGGPVQPVSRKIAADGRDRRRQDDPKDHNDDQHLDKGEATSGTQLPAEMASSIASFHPLDPRHTRMIG